MTEHRPPIESPSNPRAKAWAALANRSERDGRGLFLIEGRRETERALAHLTADEIIWCPELGECIDSSGRQVTQVSQRVFSRLSRREHPDGTALIAHTPDLSISQLNPKSPALVLAGDGIEKPGNVGAILRSCDAFDAAFLGSSLGTDVVNPNTVRAAQGSLYTTPLASAERQEAIAWAVANSNVVVAHPVGSASPWTVDLRGPTTIVIGAEHSGVHESWINAGTTVAIPMAGVADSLNASVTAGILLAEATRQRSG